MRSIHLLHPLKCNGPQLFVSFPLYIFDHYWHKSLEFALPLFLFNQRESDKRHVSIASLKQMFVYWYIYD